MTARRHFRPAGLALPVVALLAAGAAASPNSGPDAPVLDGSGPAGPEVRGHLAPPLPDGLHPTDGPDVDLRFWIEEDAVRVRADFNVAFADATVALPREVDEVVAEVEREPLARALFELCAERNTVTVDGLELDPVRGDWRFVDAFEELLPNFPLSGAKALMKVRVEYSYPLLSPPQRVALVWALYPPDTVQRLGPDSPPVEVTAQLNAGGFDYPLAFTVGEPEYIWHGDLATADEVFLPVPEPFVAAEPSRRHFVFYAFGVLFALAGVNDFRRRRTRSGTWRVLVATALIVLAIRYQARTAGTAVPTAEEAVAIFEPLHENIYRAFRFDDESKVYDALARSVDGELLEQLYGQVYRSLINEAEGGAVSRVEAVRRQSVEVENVGQINDGETAFAVDTRWEVDGAVIHWGHAHRRTQGYHARYSVAERDGSWRIVGSEVLEQRVISATPGVEEEIGTPDRTGPAMVGPANREL